MIEMQGFRPGMLAAYLATAGVLALTGVASEAEDRALPAPPGYPSKVLPALPGYASPQEAFAARREALARRDWRTAFATLTPAIQNQEVWLLVVGWTLLEGGMEGGPYHDLDEAGREAGLAGIRVIVKKYGLEYSQMVAEYDRVYLVRHGVDLVKLKKDLESRYRERTENYFREHPLDRAGFLTLAELVGSPTYIPLPPGPGEGPDPVIDGSDNEVYFEACNALAARIADKAAFYAELSEIFVSRDPESIEASVNDVADLQGVAVSGDSARGWIVWTHRLKADLKMRVLEPVRLLRKFRQLDGRWYNDNQAGDINDTVP